MNLLDHGAADTLGSIGAIMSGASVPNTSRISVCRARRLRDRRKVLRMQRGSGAGPGIRQLLPNSMAFTLPL
jgi:hypothetical protein